MAQTKTLEAGDVIVYEQDSRFSRETLVVKDGETLVVGETCMLDTGKVVTATATNEEMICLEAASPSGADGAAVFLVRNAVVDSNNLTMAGTASQAEAALKDVDATTGYGRIIVRTGPTYTTL